MKITFLGGGNMANALIGGLLANGFSASEIAVIELNEDNRARLIAQPHERLDRDRIGDEREEASGVAGGVEKIGVARGGVTGAREPGLQQRAVGGEREERQPDRGREQPDQPQRFARRRRFLGNRRSFSGGSRRNGFRRGCSFSGGRR